MTYQNPFAATSKSPRAVATAGCSSLPSASDVGKYLKLAPDSGEVFLYVNDAIQLFPFGGPFEKYYNNNSGTAQVQLQRMPLPPAPPGT